MQLFSQDVIMYCSTSGRIGGQIGSRGGIYVSFCSDFGEELEANPRRDLCSMRVRAVTILAESIKQVPNDQSAGQARLHTLDVMTSNLAVTAHHAFVREVTAGKRFSSRAVEVSRVNRMRTVSFGLQFFVPADTEPKRTNIKIQEKEKERKKRESVKSRAPELILFSPFRFLSSRKVLSSLS